MARLPTVFYLPVYVAIGLGINLAVDGAKRYKLDGQDN